MGSTGVFNMGLLAHWLKQVAIIYVFWWWWLFWLTQLFSWREFFTPFWEQVRSRGSTGRSSSKPMGFNTGLTFQHNIMVARVCVILCIALAKQIWWCLEQPKGSLLEGHTLFQKVLAFRHVNVYRTCCSLGHFGADSMKPVWIYSSNSPNRKKEVLSTLGFERELTHNLMGKMYLGDEWYILARHIQHILGDSRAAEFNEFADRSLRPSNPNMVRHYQDGSGKARVTGGAALKGSQAYPMKLLSCRVIWCLTVVLVIFLLASHCSRNIQKGTPIAIWLSDFVPKRGAVRIHE